MKKTALLTVLLLGCIGLHAQDYYLNLHHTGEVIYQDNVNGINELFFNGSDPASLYINGATGVNVFPLTAFDSITFVLQEAPQLGDTVMITYNGSAITIVNPFSDAGVSVSHNGADVTVNSTKADVPYIVSGTSDNGSLTINSNAAFVLTLDQLTLASSTTAAINIATENNVSLQLEGTTILSDHANSSVNGAFYAAGNLTVGGSGVMQVTGNGKHGLAVGGNLTMNSGQLTVLDADSDGIHCDALTLYDGSIVITQSGSDGIDCSNDCAINGGQVSVTSTAYDVKGIKAGGLLTMTGGEMSLTVSGDETKALKAGGQLTFSGGTVDMTLSGTNVNGITSDVDVNIGGTADIDINSSSQDGKCIKSDATIHINGGTLHIEHSGDVSKGITADGEITISDGAITIIASGSTILENVNNQNVPSYCTAIKSDTDITISGGTFNINLPTTNHGGKSISADGNMTITGGDFTIETHGNGAAYTVSGNTKDSYTSSCLKSDGNMIIAAGTFNLTSTGTGGKGINVGDDSHTTSTLTLGTAGGDNDDLILNVTTSGERITVSSGGGGPWGGGDYANPKAIKSRGNLTIESGTIRVNCTQTQNEGGECIESKAKLTINGGDIEAYSKKDDAVNASNNITINGGVYYAHSDANDGTDSNGTMFINGGYCISNGARMPEEGFDCDNNQFKITGGTIIGTGGGTSSPTSNVCTQPTLRINTQPSYAIQILNASGTVLCTYQCPAFTGSGGGFPGGGGNSMVMLFTDPQLSTGQTYTIKYNGTISGGTNWNGAYTGNVTYTGGQTTTVTVNSMYTSVNAGSSGGGW